MTVIIGYSDKINKVTYMGADRCMSTPYQRFTKGRSKIYQPAENPNFLLGFAGDPRVGQLVCNFVTFPRDKEIELDNIPVNERFIVRNIIPYIQKTLIDNEYDDPTLTRSQILIAYKDSVWSIGPGYQIMEVDSDYLTIGSGSFAANAVLETFEEMKINPLNRIMKSLKISTKQSVGVDGPYDFYVTGVGKLTDDEVDALCYDGFKNELIHTNKNNYISKVIKTESSINELFDSEDIMFISNENNDIYFLDYNGVLGLIRPNGDVFYDVDYSEEMHNDVWNVIELNAKGKKLLELEAVTSKFNLTSEEISE